MHTSVLVDVWHIMNRILRKIPKSHAYRSIFSVMLRDFIMEVNEEDKEKYDRVYQRKGSSYEERRRFHPGHVWKYVRRHIPQPDILKTRLETLLDTFKKDCFQDAVLKIPLLNEEAINEIQQIISCHLWCKADPVNYPMYTRGRTNSDGLTRMYSRRGTSLLEGFHKFINANITPYNAGPKYICAYLKEMVSRWNTRMSVKRRNNFPNIGHYANHLVHQIN